MRLHRADLPAGTPLDVVTITLEGGLEEKHEFEAGVNIATENGSLLVQPVGRYGLVYAPGTWIRAVVNGW